MSQKGRNWTDDEIKLLCEIVVDPSNNFLNTLETRALKKLPTKEVFQSILVIFLKEIENDEFIEVNASNFTLKRPFKPLEIDVSKLQAKYNHIKSMWRKYFDRQRNGSGLSPEKMPKWYDVINPYLADKNQGLDDIASGPADTSINENSGGEGEERENTVENEVTNLPNSSDEQEETEEKKEDKVAKVMCKPHEKRGSVRSQTQALSKLAASIDKLVDVSAKRTKIEQDDRRAFLDFKREEAEASRKHEKEMAEIYMKNAMLFSNNSFPYFQNNMPNVNNGLLPMPVQNMQSFTPQSSTPLRSGQNNKDSATVVSQGSMTYYQF